MCCNNQISNQSFLGLPRRLLNQVAEVVGITCSAAGSKVTCHRPAFEILTVLIQRYFGNDNDGDGNNQVGISHLTFALPRDPSSSWVITVMRGQFLKLDRCEHAPAGQ